MGRLVLACVLLLAVLAPAAQAETLHYRFGPIHIAPAGYGWRYRTTDHWLMNHMIHNLTPGATDVYITYDLDFIPDTAPQAAGMKEVRTMWLDVMGPPRPYPVFDVHRKAGGRDGRYTYPRESKQPGYTLNRYTVQQDGVLLGGAGHLHP